MSVAGKHEKLVVWVAEGGAKSMQSEKGNAERYHTRRAKTTVV